MKNSTIALIGAQVIAGVTIVGVVLLLLLGDEEIRGVVLQGVVSTAGAVGALFLGWLSRRIRLDDDGDGTPNDFDPTPQGDEESGS